MHRPLSPERVSLIIKEAVDIEREFVCEALPVRLLCWSWNANFSAKFSLCFPAEVRRSCA